MNKLMTAVLLLALAPAAYSQKAAPRKAPAAKAKPAVAASTAAPAAQSAEAARTAEVLARLKAWDDKLDSLSADFTQEVDFREAGLKQSIEGNLRYVKPNLLRIEHVKPARQIVVTDKSLIWIYKPEDKQAVRTDWEAWRRTQDQNFSGILDFGNYASLTAKNNAAVSGGKDGKPWKVVFTPKSGSAYRLTLTLSPEDYFPTAAELLVDNTLIRTELKSVTRNGKIDEAVFKFSPPKGVEILEFNK